VPSEYTLLIDKPEALEKCPRCLTRPFRSFLRGQVHSYWRKFWRRPYCCLICSECKEIVGYEKP